MERKRKKKNPDPGFSGESCWRDVSVWSLVVVGLDYAQAQYRQYQRLTKQFEPDLSAYEKQKMELWVVCNYTSARPCTPCSYIYMLSSYSAVTTHSLLTPHHTFCTLHTYMYFIRGSDTVECVRLLSCLCTHAQRRGYVPWGQQSHVWRSWSRL